jgi:hypothetical protein
MDANEQKPGQQNQVASSRSRVSRSRSPDKAANRAAKAANTRVAAGPALSHCCNLTPPVPVGVFSASRRKAKSAVDSMARSALVGARSRWLGGGIRVHESGLRFWTG